jgi:hypothetical protein
MSEVSNFVGKLKVRAIPMNSGEGMMRDLTAPEIDDVSGGAVPLPPPFHPIDGPLPNPTPPFHPRHPIDLP